METDYPIGNLVLYEGDAKANIFYRSEASYAELLAVNEGKMILSLWPLNTVIVVPKSKVRFTRITADRLTDLGSFMVFFIEASRKMFGTVPSMKLQKKCLRALVQSLELTGNALTKEQGIKIVMRILKLNN
jgi:hypothetical protein